jgi:hypothetical protein
LILAYITLLYLLCGLAFPVFPPLDRPGAGWLERLILAVAFGLALSLVSVYIMGLLRIRVTDAWLRGLLAGLVGLNLLVVSVRVISLYRDTPAGGARGWRAVIKRALPRFAPDRYDILFVALFILAALVRVLQVQELFVPNWTDGLTHQNAIDRIIRTGVIPVSNIYHSGFYFGAVFIKSLLGLHSPEASLLFGQWLSLVAGLGFYLLGLRFSGSKAIALISLAFYWFLAPFPAYLISWARYAYLLGFTLLPATVIMSLEWMDKKSTFYFFLTAIFACALLLSHYSMILMWAVFLGAVLTWGLIKGRTHGQRDVFKKSLPPGWFYQAGLLIIMLVLFFSPKLGFLAADWDVLPRRIAQSRAMDAALDTFYMFRLTFQHGGILLWIFGLVGMFRSVREIPKASYLILAWLASMFVLAGVQVLAFATSIPSLTNLVIFLPLLLALFAGAGFRGLFEAPDRSSLLISGSISRGDSVVTTSVIRPKERLKALLQSCKPLTVALTGGLAILTLAGAYVSLGIVNPTTVLFSAADRQARDWIAQNTRPADTFLINSFLWGAWYIPSDGGGWITPLTGRKTKYPPSAEQLDDIRKFIRANHIRYIYIGRGYGEIDSNQFEARDYVLVYNQSGIRIYRVLVEGRP